MSITKLKIDRFILSANISIGVATVILVLLFYRQGIYLTLMLLSLSLPLLALNWSKRTLVLYIIGALLFPFCEMLCVNTGMNGIWHYMYSYDQFFMIETKILGIPLWLLPVWGIVTVLIRRTQFNVIK